MADKQVPSTEQAEGFLLKQNNKLNITTVVTVAQATLHILKAEPTFVGSSGPPPAARGVGTLRLGTGGASETAPT